MSATRGIAVEHCLRRTRRVPGHHPQLALLLESSHAARTWQSSRTTQRMSRWDGSAPCGSAFLTKRGSTGVTTRASHVASAGPRPWWSTRHSRVRLVAERRRLLTWWRPVASRDRRGAEATVSTASPPFLVSSLRTTPVGWKSRAAHGSQGRLGSRFDASGNSISACAGAGNRAAAGTAGTSCAPGSRKRRVNWGVLSSALFETHAGVDGGKRFCEWVKGLAGGRGGELAARCLMPRSQIRGCSAAARA